jgi:NADH dehydrogenase
MMILIVGATGLLGGTITRQLLGQGKEVRILVRRNSPSEELAKLGMATPAQALIEAGAQAVYGDLKDRASLDAACQGIDTLITTANSALRGGEDNVETVDLKGNRSLIDAAAGAGAKHAIFISALTADPDSPVPFLKAKALSEEHLCASGMDYTILAPDTFAEIWVGAIVGTPLRMGKPITLVGEARRKHSFVSLVDVAAFAVAAVDNPAAVNQRVLIGGPEAVSWREVVAACEKVLGRELATRFVAMGEPIPDQSPEIAGLMTAMESYDSVVDMRENARTFGVALTPLEAVLSRMFAQARS